MTNTLAPHPQYTVGTWQIDPTHSTISFSVKHLMISKVRGTFEKFSGTIVTAENPAESSIEATIEIASVNTNQPDRDNHLRTNDFFKADEFPTMTFRSTDFDVDGDDFTVTGDLTLRGVTKSVTLKGEFGGIITNGYGQTVAAASATTKINRHDFGVSWNAALEAGGMTLGDEVTISLELQAVKA
ncbi:YceI family protein [Salinibacterium sp. SYSU T00001]|uniref:YceI family protein n=1 Tax=Homoserinimonas sedimenticola TaxID=2986805 RepID=UPI0022354518|nr:YceI family protein [Salinibacterium sedimenticola]MCW4384747.1 YceI family protein [Salinibacterium sedimenticola]